MASMSEPQATFDITYSRDLYNRLRRANDDGFLKGYFEVLADEIGSTTDATVEYVASILVSYRRLVDKTLGPVKAATRRSTLNGAEETAAATVAPTPEVATQILEAVSAARTQQRSPSVTDSGPDAGPTLGLGGPAGL